MCQKLLASFFSVLFFSACISNADETEPNALNRKTDAKYEQISAKRDQVYAELNALGDINSCKTSSDCAAMPLGSRACGGPSNYMAYAKSIDAAKLAELKRLAEQTKEMDIKLNKLSGIMSTCVYLSPPALICEDNICNTSTGENTQ